MPQSIHYNWWLWSECLGIYFLCWIWLVEIGSDSCLLFDLLFISANYCAMDFIAPCHSWSLSTLCVIMPTDLYYWCPTVQDRATPGNMNLAHQPSMDWEWRELVYLPVMPLGNIYTEVNCLYWPRMP